LRNDGSAIVVPAASSLTLAGPRPSRLTTERRVGSAKAAKTRSTVGDWLAIWLSSAPAGRRCQGDLRSGRAGVAVGVERRAVDGTVDPPRSRVGPGAGADADEGDRGGCGGEDGGDDQRDAECVGHGVRT